MARGQALVFWALWTCSACSLTNPPEPRPAPPGACVGYSCESDPCGACDPSASCVGTKCRCLPGYLDLLGDGTHCKPEPGAQQDPEQNRNLVLPPIQIPNPNPPERESKPASGPAPPAKPDLDAGPTPACHNAGDCSVNARCEIDDGEAVCRCVPGYTDQNGACKNVDECVLQQHDCGENERCIDTPGSFSCQCTPGYSRVGVQCINDDACAAEPCGAHEACTTLPGSYRCDCAPGYIAAGDNECIDSEECANGALQCIQQARCESRPGPDACVCYPYFAVELDDGKRKCEERIGFRWYSPFAGRLRLGGGADGTVQDELILLDYPFDGDGGNCSDVFTAQPGTDFLLSVLPVRAKEPLDGEVVPKCRWARDLHLGGGAIVARALDRRGAVVLDLSLGEGQATIDGSKVGVPGRENLLYFAPGGAFVWAAPILCEASQTPGAQLLVDLTTDPRGDVYALLRFDATCPAAGNTLPQATSDNVAIMKLARDTGAVLWAKSAVDEPGTSVDFNGLAVAPDGNVYVSGNVYTGQADFGTPTAASAGFVLALDTNGATRWLHPLADAERVDGIAAGAVDSVQVMSSTKESESQMRVFDAHGLDPRDGQETWQTRVATNGYSLTDISSDARGRTIVAVSVSGTGTIGGDPVLQGGGQIWNGLIALDASGNVRWTRALVRGSDGINGAQMTPTGDVLVSGKCAEPCTFEAKWGTFAGNFTLRLRI